ncbi:MAG TPA: hypothetical protein VLX30_00500 [Burkholderiales bacterium]|nr:hypothetical protein [Burkholderiales bacterium]
MRLRFLPAVLLAAASLARAELPTVQPGEWVLKSKLNGQPHESRLCGNPLERVAAAIAAARASEKLGCSVRVDSHVPRTTNVIVDCPADRASEDGAQRVRKGLTELSVNAASMQSVWIDLRRAGHHETVDAERVGDCKP